MEIEEAEHQQHQKQHQQSKSNTCSRNSMFMTLGANELKPVDSPPSPPKLPGGLKGIWTYTEETRMFLVNFRNLEKVPNNDMEFLLDIMSRDDLVVVIEGLWDASFERFMTLENLKRYMSNQVCHDLRVFTQNEMKNGIYEEKSKGLSMCAKDFF